MEQVEIAIVEDGRTVQSPAALQACGDIPPAEFEATYYSQKAALTEVGHSEN